MKHLFRGNRSIRDELRGSGFSKVGRGHAGALMKKMDIVWATDITYLPMAKGFCYLTAVMDWASRKALSWRLSNMLDASFCADALEEAIVLYGVPDIFNTDQGSQAVGCMIPGSLSLKNRYQLSKQTRPALSATESISGSIMAAMNSLMEGPISTASRVSGATQKTVLRNPCQNAPRLDAG